MRPSMPLLSKEKVCEVALELIAEDGLEAVTIRRIAERFGVNGASLYHHFRSKEEIVAGAAQLALSRAHLERFDGERWDEWCLRSAERLYSLLSDYPNLVTVLIRRNDLQVAFEDVDFYFAEFERQGVAIELMWTLMESLQALAVGTVIQQQAGLHRSAPEMDAYPSLSRATRARSMGPDEAFLLGCRALIDSIDQRSAAAATDRSAQRRSGLARQS